MGANQSTIPINEKLLAERLEGLKIQGDDLIENTPSDEYVYVSEKSKHFKAPWSSLSVGDVADWEHELLADPKNRYSTSYSCSTLFESMNCTNK